MKSIVLLLVLSSFAVGQVSVTTDPFGYAGSSQHKHEVRDAAGTLYMLSVFDDGAGNRPLLLNASVDDGATWSALPFAINDATSGLSGTNTTNGCSLTIDSTGRLHIMWGSYYYPSFYQQWYRQIDPLTGTLSALVNLTTLAGSSATVRTSAMNMAVDASDTIWLAVHGTTSWVTRLYRSAVPGATNLVFNDVGRVSVSASAQNVRLAVDVNGVVHTSYYRNTGNGDYAHRAYDPNVGWSAETTLGNAGPTNDFWGMLAADALGQVHALVGQDLASPGTWQWDYRVWNGTAFGPPIPVFSVASSVYTGVSSYQIAALAVEESTGVARVIYRDLNAGGGLVMVDPNSIVPSVFPVTGPATGNNELFAPATRGTLWPVFNRTDFGLDVSWRRGVAPGPYDLVTTRIGSGGAAASLNLAGPAVVGQNAFLNLLSPTNPGQLYFCGFSGATTPAFPIPGGVLPLANDPILQLSLMVNTNGIFFNNLGTLDNFGVGVVTIAVPPFPSLAGATVYAAFAVQDPAVTFLSAGAISPPLAITVQ